MRVHFLVAFAVLGCGPMGSSALSDAATIYEPATDGTDTTFVGAAGHGGTMLLVVSTRQWAGAVGYAMRIDGNGAKVGELTRIDAADWPQQVTNVPSSVVQVSASSDGWAILTANQTIWIDATGAAAVRSGIGADRLPLAGFGPSATGVAAFSQSACSAAVARLDRLDVTQDGTIATPVTPCESVAPQGLTYVAAFDGTLGGAAVRIALPTSGAITPLDAQGDAAGSATTFTSTVGPAFGFASVATSSATGAALVVGSTVITWTGGTIAQSMAFPGWITGLVGLPTSYVLSYSVTSGTGPCAELGACLVQIDTAGKVIGSAHIGANDGNYSNAGSNLCTHPVLASDGAGNGQIVALCSDGAGFVSRTASSSAPSSWRDSWRLPGSIFGLDAFGSPNGALVAIEPFHHRGGGAPDAVLLDATGAPRVVVPGAPAILGASETGFLARGDTQLLLLDADGAQTTAIDTPGMPVAAVAIGGGGLVLARQSGVGSTLLRFDATSATPTVASTAAFEPDAFCPADPTDTVLAYGYEGARRLTSGGVWLDATSITLPTAPTLLPRADCWSCGPSCWVLAYREGGMFRLEVTANGLTTTQLGGVANVETAAAGDLHHGVVATLDASSSSIVVQRLTGRGDADGAPLSIPVTTDIVAADSKAAQNNASRIGVAMLDPSHYAVVHVASDGIRETVARRIVSF